MDKHYVETILEGLKSSTSKCVQETLVKIRNKVTANKDGIKLFTECDGLNALVPHLRKPNERILDLTLSILGNCFTNDECRVEVSKLNIVSPVITVLKTVSRDSIVGRACRVIGNIAQKYSDAEDLHNHGAVPALVNLIENRDKTTSCPTLTMAVRALRQLWIVRDKREEMLSLNSVRCISLLLISVCETVEILPPPVPKDYVPMRKSQEELINTILKSFVCFTTQATIQCAEQIQTDGKGYICLAKLMKDFTPLAVQCVTNLCFMSACRPTLGDTGILSSLIGVLRCEPVYRWPEGGARALALLCSESVNRARIRHQGGLCLLVTAAREHTFVLQALLQFVFDDLSFEILVKEGLVHFLINELKDHVKTMDNEHDYKEPAKDHNDKKPFSLEPVDSEDKGEDKYSDEKTGLFKRRKCSGDDDELNVVIERDNMLVGFNETINESDESLEEAPQRKQLKRLRSTSPTSFKKRSRIWGTEVYWEMKSERDGASTSRHPRSPEAPTSPGSDGASGFSPDARRRLCDWSPESGFEGSATSPHWTGYQWSPASSGPTSPFSGEESSDSEVSGRYSPVCSEHEVEEGAAPAAVADSVVDAAQAALDVLVMDDSETQDDEPFPFGLNAGESYLDLNSSRIACVLILMYRVTNGSCVSTGPGPVLPSVSLEGLTRADCLQALLDYTENSRRPMGRAARVLSLIFDNAMCLTSILKRRLVLRLHDMSTTHKHTLNKCLQCRLLNKFSTKLITRLTMLAEASYGVGEISYQLQRGTDYMKNTLALTLPYIVKSKMLLRRYYVTCRAIDILFESVPDNEEEFKYYVTALGKLATNVRIKDPKLLETRFTDHITVTYDPILDNLSKEEIVTFELDDMSTVKANKTFLCQNSEVFSAMLMGRFKESIEETVQIKNVTKDGLEYLLSLLHFGVNKTKCEIKVFPMAEDLETNLEVLLLADRFLFDKLKILLNSAILQFKMLPETADNIYIWSLGDGMGFLCVESVAYLLTGKMLDKDRAQAFRNILELDYKEQFLDDVQSLIKRELERMA